MNALSAGAVLEARYESLKQKRLTFSHEASIENTVSKLTNNTSIELPQEIKDLITGSGYWVQAKTNRYKMLARQGYLQHLLYLANMARTKKDIRNPANWFASVCSVKKWEAQTLPFLKKAFESAKQAAYTAQKLGTEVTNFIYKQVWRGVNTVRLACLAAETPHAKHGQSTLQHFAWLCANESRLAIASTARNI